MGIFGLRLLQMLIALCTFIPWTEAGKGWGGVTCKHPHHPSRCHHMYKLLPGLDHNTRLRQFMEYIDDDFLFVDHELIACYGHICAFFENTLSIERGRGTEFWRTSGREAKHLMQALKHMGCATCGRASIGYPEIHDLNSPEGYLKVDFIDRPDCFGPCNPNSRRKAVVAGNAADETEPMDPIHSENVGIQDEHRDKLCCRRHSRSQYYYCEFIDRYGPNTDNCEGPGKSQEGFPKNLYPDKYRGSKQGEHGVHWLKEKPPIDASRPQGFRL